MRFEYIRLKNYVGILSGMNLEEIKIDLTKSIHNKVVIKGRNGSGKSTLMNSIHIFPDTNNSFVQGRPAEKELMLVDNDIRYNILIRHGIKPNGDRETTKAYIRKIYMDGHYEELNPNGNISSYKDIVYNEFLLDSNFISLSKLGVEDRGLVDKSPSERKRFVNSILSNLDIYNDIHKNLTKKSSILKSMMNSISTKMNNLGDEDSLNVSLKNIEGRLNLLYNQRDIDISNISKAEVEIKSLDPNGDIQNKYNEIYSNISTINGKCNDVSSVIKRLLNKYNLNEYEDVIYYKKDIESDINKLSISIGVSESKIENIIKDKENKSDKINSYLAKVASFKFDSEFNDLEKQIKESEERLVNYKNTLSSIGLNDISNISKDEFIIGLETLKEIKESIDVFKSNRDYHIISKAIEYIDNNSYPDIEYIKSEINNLNNEIKNLELQYQKYETLLSVTEKLNMRPNNCKIDSCEFIKDALDALRQNPQDKLNEIRNQLLNLKSSLSDNTNKLKEYELIISCINNLNVLIRTIGKNILILRKLPIESNLYDKNELLNSILSGYEFKEIDEMYSYIEYSNVIDLYKREKESLSKLKDYYNDNKNNIDMIVLLNDKINELNNEMSDLDILIEKERYEIMSNKDSLSKLNNILINLDNLLDNFSIYEKLKESKNNYLSEFEKIKNDIILIKQYNDDINSLRNNISILDREINPLLSNRDEFIHNLKLINEYREELEIYNNKYEVIDTVRKYSSPTTGIQTLFIEMYMNKMIELSNDLLSLLFDGRYIIGRLDINESEFKIPCIGKDGMMVDDISSMSTSEKCMISMIISFVLLFQSSTKFNILKLDEIDGGLDTRNRLNFLIVLDELLNLLKVEQVFIVSHNNEIDLENCDIILLNYTDDDISGNVIFSNI